ncbi:unnamed protein product [Cylindrotheca closterium]|uniref:Methyltransferase FkbM domain-containing protein n=1 Tax=Cylindrotheca closterium TaxID=2856 RepID=A0AAD2FWT0_9STRA|nr:unnamed protein product [Cylindrotheca closterium]
MPHQLARGRPRLSSNRKGSKDERNLCRLYRLFLGAILLTLLLMSLLAEGRNSYPLAALPAASITTATPSEMTNRLLRPYSKPSYVLPFPLPVPRDLHVEKLLPKLLNLFSNTNENPSLLRLVNLGAGVRDDDPTFPLLDDPTQKWEALLMDGDPNQETAMAERFPSDKIQTHFAYITAGSIPNILSKHGFDQNVDLLKIDIDSFDCFVMDSILKTVRPSVIVMEVNVKFPANIRFAMLPGFVSSSSSSESSSSAEQYPFDSEQRGHLYGCSLAYQVHDLMRPNGYEVLYLDSNNAVFYDKQKEDLSAGLKDYTPSSMTDLYNRGYWNMPDRTTAFAFNNELARWQKLKANDIFSDLATRSMGRPLLSHGRHHVVIGDLVNDGKGQQPPLLHGCFDHITGALKDAESSPESCSWSIIPV